MEVKIIPTGGLCNRLRAIATGVAVAKSYHCPSVIYWNNSRLLRTFQTDSTRRCETDREQAMAIQHQWQQGLSDKMAPAANNVRANRVQLQYLPRWRDIQQIENELFTLAPPHLVLSYVYEIYYPGDVRSTR